MNQIFSTDRIVATAKANTAEVDRRYKAWKCDFYGFYLTTDNRCIVPAYRNASRINRSSAASHTIAKPSDLPRYGYKYSKADGGKNKGKSLKTASR